ncbi:MAG: hypothetical protein L0Z62_02765 [Gemmataceae bacterium]|nr:hypothetical protein [Gemmataceae bacterium]
MAHARRDCARRVGHGGPLTARSLRSPFFLLSILALSAALTAGAPAQEGGPRSRAGASLPGAREHYTRGDYEQAAQLLAQVDARQAELTPAERTDLAEQKRQTDLALLQRRDGAARLAQAEEALSKGHPDQAASLVKTLSANQYLSPADKQRLAQLTERLRNGGPGSDLKEDYRTLVGAARAAYERGDLDRADQLARQAERIGSRVPAWMQPWNDNSGRVLRDVSAARARQAAAARDAAKNGPKQERPEPAPAQPQAARDPLSSGYHPTREPTPKGVPAGDGKTPTEAPRSDSPYASLPTPSGSRSMTAVGAPPPPAPQVRESQYHPTQRPAHSPETAQAMRILEKGREALTRNDLETAYKCAEQARALRPQLNWWDYNPDKLIAEIRRRSPGNAPAPEVAQNADPGPGPEGQPLDARALLREGRALFKQGKLDDADRLSLQAAAVPGVRWGLFEDSPDRLRLDVQKARARHDREESARLLVEARADFKNGDLPQARAKAQRARQLHGSYSVWDMGDRPDRLLAEIHTAEMEQRKKASTSEQSVAQGPPPPGGAPKAQPISRAPIEAKQRSAGLLKEARDLQRKGMLLEARQKAVESQRWAVEAYKGGLAFERGEDTPEIALGELGLACEHHVHGLVRLADDCVKAAGRDPNAVNTACMHLTTARQLAHTFGLETYHVDQRLGALQQMQQLAQGPPIADPSGNPQSAIRNPQFPMGGQGVAVAGGPKAGVPGAPAVLDKKDPRTEGLDLLARGRLEMSSGQLHLARNIGEQVFMAAANRQDLGLQEEARRFLNMIDLEELNQRRNAVNRKFDDGLDAFNRRDYALARTILAALDADLALLTPERQDRLRNIASTKEMQPGQVALAGGLPKQQGVPGRAIATDMAPAPAPKVDSGEDDSAERIRKLEEIQLKKLHNDSLEEQRRAIASAKGGDYDSALDILQGFLQRLEGESLSKENHASLKRQVESRMAGYRKLKAQKDWEKKQELTRVTGDGHRREKQRILDLQMKQNKIVDLIEQCNALVKEGKHDEALVLAYKAREIDPDNVTVDMAIQMGKIKRELARIKVKKDQNEQYRLDAWHDAERLGNYLDGHKKVIDFDPEITRRAQKRGPGHIELNRMSTKEREIERRLSMPVSLNFKDTPLSQVIQDLHNITGVNVVEDSAALQEASINTAQPLTLRVEDISLKSALNILLKKAALTYVIKDEALQITTEQHAKGKRKVVTYPVADLVVPIPNHELPAVCKFNEVAMKHYNGGGLNYGGPMPLIGAGGMPFGQQVSSPNSGTGYGSMGGHGAPMANPPKPPGSTIEAELINLITKTIAPETWSDVGGKGTIQYFPTGLALVINQVQDVQEQVQDLLAALRRLQDLEVAIEMRLVSVSESFFERLAFDFDLNIVNRGQSRWEQQLVTQQFAPPGFINAFRPDGFFSGLTPAGTFTPDLGVPLKASSFDFSLPPFGGYPGTLGADGGLTLGLAFLSDVQVFLLLEAAQGDRRYNTVQAPKITVFNGQQAFIQVQDAQFFLTQINVVPIGSQLVFQPQNSPLFFGVTLQVTPVVSADRRFVRLNMQPSLTNLFSATVPLVPIQIPVDQLFYDGITGVQPVIFQTFFQQPAVGQINLQTTVVIPDGGTVLLGGLKALSEGRNEFGPPVLSKIPYLNRLFKNVGYGRETQSLMILVTARIIINEEEELIYRGELPPVPR